MSNTNTFHLGLCMAGAVSAGAYTAGVIDYLMEALMEWQKRKDNNEPNIPSHNVQISVVGGASAGGMTGIILASAINKKYVPVSAIPNPVQTRQPNNKLYHSWVDLVADDMFPLLLKTDDIKVRQIYSLLNSGFIDQIADRVVKVEADSEWVYPAFIDKHLKVFVTLSNLQGFPYNVSFKSNVAQRYYLMSVHNDYACFVLNKKSNEYNKDGWIPLDFQHHVNTTLARDAAMATGAFPIGLKARSVTRECRHVHENHWLKDILSKSPEPCETDLMQTLNVDGGLINNEPFEKVQQMLLAKTGETPEQQQRYDTFRSTMLMVDPFPSEEVKFNDSQALMTVMGNTLSAMIAQMRAKREVLEDAFSDYRAGQFLISPSRPDPANPSEIWDGSRAIASGTFDGFGGFLDKRFRIHDFFLGRANCERFLRRYFTVPATTANPIFKNGYNNIIDKTPFTSPIDGGLQIIPLFKNEGPTIPLPVFPNGSNWPVLKEKEVERFDSPLRKRAQELLMNFGDYGRITNALLWIGAKVVLNRKLADAVLKAIKVSLEKHTLISK